MVKAHGKGADSTGTKDTQSLPGALKFSCGLTWPSWPHFISIKVIVKSIILAGLTECTVYG